MAAILIAAILRIYIPKLYPWVTIRVSTSNTTATRTTTASPTPDEIGIHQLKGDGDFEEECVRLLKQADIVVTNPPFSFREYVEQLIKYKKKFLIIGNQNAISYKKFELIKGNKIWLGDTHPWFHRAGYYESESEKLARRERYELA